MAPQKIQTTETFESVAIAVINKIAFLKLGLSEKIFLCKIWQDDFKKCIKIYWLRYYQSVLDKDFCITVGSCIRWNIPIGKFSQGYWLRNTNNA